MSLVVPFDGGELSEAALERATEFAAVLDEPVVAVTVVRIKNDEYAREVGWLDADEPYDLDTIVGRLREQVKEVSPAAEFVYETVDRYAPTGTVSKRIKRVAHDRNASIVVIGSDNAGHVVSSISSVGGSVAAGSTYDVLIVRQP
jgi:nucleotide-binding universal stress UspA family protein